MPEFHFEPYLSLAGVTHNAALIAWGGFYFKVRGRELDGRWKLVDDSNLDHVHPPRRETIGARSEPYGVGLVEVLDSSGAVVASDSSATTNHTWVTGLTPDTEYTYRVTVNGEPWAQGELRDWVTGPQGQGLLRTGRRYENRFRTNPHPDTSAPLTFAVIGDFGIGVRKPSTPTRCQREVAAALEQAVAERGVRLVLTTGDNIYARKVLFLPVRDTGDEDDDWFFTYYQPYRYAINRVPVYPSVGNHDEGEIEDSDDREQILDNFFISERFAGQEPAGRSSVGPGLFYRFRYGADIEFVSLDTSRRSVLFGRRLFEHPNHAAFLESAFPEASEPGHAPVWRIPFGHHPPFCAGPRHRNTRSVIERLVPLFERSGVRAVFSGHEHNFQLSRVGQVNYFLTGAAGKVSLGPPSDFADAHTVAWASTGHFLVVDVDRERMVVTPVGEIGPDGRAATVAIAAPNGEPVATPIVISSGLGAPAGVEGHS